MDEIGFLVELVSIPSPSSAEEAVAAYLLEQMDALGFAVRQDRAGNVLGSIGPTGAAREIVLLGHMDTVPSQLPVKQDGPYLYGRGAVDAKGPLAAFVVGAARVANRLEESRVTVIGAVEEEDPQGRGAHHLIETYPAPDCVLVGEPSAWEGITLGYKGLMSLDYRWVQPGAHSAGREIGPAEKAITFWNHLIDYAEARNENRWGRFDTLDPALRDFHTFDQGADKGVEMNVVMRLPPGLDPDALKGRMESWAAGADLSDAGYEPCYRSEKNTPPVRALLCAIRAEGGRPRFKLKTGTSDMNVVSRAWTCPMVAYGPGDSALDHTPEEHIDLREYRHAINVLTRALLSLAS